MAVRGTTQNVALAGGRGGFSSGYKDLDEFEITVPNDIDRRNGFLSDAGDWVKRPGFGLAYTCPITERVDLLIPEDTGYAVLENGNVFKLGKLVTRLSGHLNGKHRPNWVNSDDKIILADGGTLSKINSLGVVPLGGSPPGGVRWLGVVNAKLVIAGYDTEFGTEFRWSDEGNNESWTDSNFTNIESEGQEIRHFRVFKERLFFFKDHNIEVWDDVGGSAVFARSFFIQKGTLASDSVVQANDTLFWLGDDGDFYGLNGVQQEAISKPVHRELMSLSTKNDCYGLVFRQETCIRWFFPTAGRCFRYDYYKNSWSEDSCWETGQWTRLPVASHMELNGKSYVGDYAATGKVYEWGDAYKTDNGLPIRVYRRFSVRLDDSGAQARLNRAQFRVKRGVATSTERAPEFMVRYRLDRGEWGDTQNLSLGKEGDTQPYVAMTNLGIGREAEFELVETDATEWLVTDLNLTSRSLGR